MATLTSSSLATSTRPPLVAPRSAVARTGAAASASRLSRARIALAVATSFVAVAATSAVIVMITMLPAGDLEVITGLIGLMN